MSKITVQKIIASLPKSSPKTMTRFTKALFEKVDLSEFVQHTPDMLADIASKHWDLLKVRKPGKPEISLSTYMPKGHEGSHLGRTVIDMVNENMPFLVDSVAAMITNKYKLIHTLMHPILHITYDKKGALTDAHIKQKDDTVAQSHIHIELNGVLSKSQLKELKKDLEAILKDVHFATRDWLLMKDKLRECQKSVNNAPVDQYSETDIEEYIHFLEYLHRDNFTLLGFREYKFTKKSGKIHSQTVKGSSLGLLHDDLTPVYINETDTGLPDILQKLRFDLPPVFVSKVNKNATVHRPVPIDAVAVKKYDKKGQIIGEYLFIGLFTSVTYSRSIEDIPLLRQKTDTAMMLSGFQPNSHDYKALRHVLEKYPRDELFQIDVEYLLDICTSILRLQERQRIALYTRSDPFGRYVSCLVYVPRERYDTKLRVRMQGILEEELEGVCGNYYANVDDSTFARILYMVYISQDAPPKYNLDRIERKLQDAGRLWSERLSNALYKEMDNEGEILSLVSKYGNAFPVNYTENYKAKQSYYDILHIENVIDDGIMRAELYRPKRLDSNRLRLKLFQKDRPVTLSSVLPVLENMGLKAISEDPYEINPLNGHEQKVWIHDFLVSTDNGHSFENIKDVKDLFEDAVVQAWYGRIENDPLNKLILFAGLTWRQIVILRAYVRYMRQMRYHYDTAFIERALSNNPDIARELVYLFEAYHDPARQKDAKTRVSKHLENIEQALENVVSLDEDKIIRTLSNVIWSTLRTNFYQKNKDGTFKEYLSIKLDSKTIDELPDPKPYREIFVYSTRMEGVHLRGDVIARGGIRWSDRNEDFRTEILGLMKAQQVKNSVIVPMGAKGGFVVKKSPPRSDWNAFLEEGVNCYKTLVRGLLDITDNRKGKRIVPPKDVVCRDATDPYLVVAADKGTATFSDIANGLSGDYGFWLDDAFASGGSAGYDHKVMGITARGAWESVKRHFRELNHDTQTQEFDVIGVGDMGGDVFGNGMLLSEKIRLVGAFNHLHIFCDPDPDCESSFKERTRLFKAVKGWDAYDESKLSKGGRIYKRSDKSLQLTPEIKSRFDIQKDKVTPGELMRAMLKARTDLLWFGGIGTYIKSEEETHVEVGDKANDSIRINADEVRARVIGEGANLGVTHDGRIEFSSKGGAINADFIDNSGGVDSSDHEVNIKILMSEVMANDKYAMTIKKRNVLLEKMTEEVSQLVLRNNYQQAQGISLMQSKAVENFGAHVDLIEMFEDEINLNRELESLPDDEEIESRKRQRKGLTRPEIATLQSYVKIEYTRDLLKTKIPDMSVIADEWLVNYFPVPLRKKYINEIQNHRLKREIIATRIATMVVNRMGSTFLREKMNKTGASVEEVTLAFLTVCDVFDLYSLWSQIEALDNKIPAQVQINAFLSLRDLAKRGTRWFLTRLGRPVDIDDDIESFGDGVKKLRQNIQKIVSGDIAKDLKKRKDAYAMDGLPSLLARDLAAVPILSAACDIISSGLECNKDMIMTARTYLEVGEAFDVNWLHRQADYMKADGRWAEEALSTLVDQLYQVQAALTTHILQTTKAARGEQASKQSLVEKWMDKNAAKVSSYRPIIKEMKEGGSLDIPMLIIAEQRLRHLVES